MMIIIIRHPVDSPITAPALDNISRMVKEATFAFL